MITIVAILVYVLSGTVKIEQLPAKDLADCEAKAKARIEELVKDPRFDEGLLAVCAPVRSQEVRS